MEYISLNNNILDADLLQIHFCLSIINGLMYSTQFRLIRDNRAQLVYAI